MDKLHISSIEIKNFMSYGNYVSKLDLDALGPALIIGDNGAGKSSLINAVLWCLTGRLPHIPNPGDKVVNWYTGSDCFVSIQTKDGWTIKRTRLLDNHDDLIVHNNNHDETRSTNKNAQELINNHFGLDFDIFTNSVFCGQTDRPLMEMADQKRRAVVERMLGLDKFDELSNAAKEKLEKSVNKYKINKEKRAVLSQNLQSILAQIDDNEDRRKGHEIDRQTKIGRLSSDLDQFLSNLDDLETFKEDKIKKQWEIIGQINIKIDKIDQTIESINTKISHNNKMLEHLIQSKSEIQDQIRHDINIDDIQRQYDLCVAQESKLNLLLEKKTEFDNKLTSFRSVLSDAQRRHELWVSKNGAICPECEQEIKSSHVEKNCERINKEIHKAQNDVDRATAKLSQISDVINSIEIKWPDMNIDEAKRLVKASEHAQERLKTIQIEISQIESDNKGLTDDQQRLADLRKQLLIKLPDTPDISLDELAKQSIKRSEIQSNINMIRQEIDHIKNEINPYEITISTLKDNIKFTENEIEEIDNTINNLQVLNTHIDYVHRAYRDRNKIRSYLLGELVPFLNERISYYLKEFDLKMNIEFTSSLGIKSSLWDYALCSGGQKKRIDLSIMFAIHDLHILLHGQRCNLLILDEVDGRLDAEGINKFVEIINNDFTGDPPRPETVLVISHKLEMANAFPTKIKISLKDGFSYIEHSG